MEKEGFVRKILEGKQKGDMDERWPALNVILLAIQYPGVLSGVYAGIQRIPTC